MLFSTSTRRVRDLNSDYTNQELDPRPSFQRGYVWDLAKASRLIESVLLNVPLPLIYTAEEADNTKEVVIDGQQRLLTLFGYIKGEFPRNGRPFRLKHLKILSDLNGKLFNELDDPYRTKILRYDMTIIKIGSSSDPNVKFEIFERLNSGSVSLNPQELTTAPHPAERSFWYWCCTSFMCRSTDPPGLTAERCAGPCLPFRSAP